AGPYNVTGVSETPARKRLFICKPTTAAKEAPCAAEILSAVARRAFRRAVTAADIKRPMDFYTDARKGGGDFDAGIRAGLARILGSPAFVFRAEEDPASLPPRASHP